MLVRVVRQGRPRLLVKNLLNANPESRQEFILEPQVASEPVVVARTGVRQWHDFRPMVAPRLYPFRYRTAGIGQMISLSVFTDDESQPQFIEVLEQFLTPLTSTFGSRRQVTVSTSPRVTESHRQDRKLLRVVESHGGNTEPPPKAIPTGIGKRYSGVMYLSTWGLTGDEDAGRLIHLQHRPRAERDVFRTYCAVPDIPKQLWEWNHGSKNRLKASGLLAKNARKTHTFRRQPAGY